MLEARSWLWRWLAEQPAFVEVGIGMFFVLIIAPAALTAVAIVLAHAEAVVGVIVSCRFTGRSAPLTALPSKRVVFGEHESR